MNNTWMDRLNHDLVVRNVSVKTQKSYSCYVRRFSQHFGGKSPNSLNAKHIREYLQHLIDRDLSWSSYNLNICALRFFYTHSSSSPRKVKSLPFAKQEETLPLLPDREEVRTILKAVDNDRHQMILMLMYASGMRVGEAVSVKVKNVDGKQRTIHIEKAKSRCARLVPLSPRVLIRLRDYFRKYHPSSDWLFEGGTPGTHLRTRPVQKSFRDARRMAGIQKNFTTHSLRHGFATHMLEDGHDIRIIQKILGHKNIQTTLRYARVTPIAISQVVSPFDKLSFD
jgi:integrase/recombinase XerD